MNPFEDQDGIQKLEARLGVFVGRFRALAEGMQDLPLYNHAVGVEPVDFLPFGEMGFGVLVTPWFISALFIPLEHVPFSPQQVGLTDSVPLPAGQRVFQLGGDEVLGLYWAHALISPLSGIPSHDAALARARADLTQILSLPAAPLPARQRRTVARRTVFAAARPAFGT